MAGVCAAIIYWGGRTHDQLATIALIVGAIAALVAAFTILGMILAGLAAAADVPKRMIENKLDDRRHARLDDSRARHQANRAQWLREARSRLAAEAPPAWDKGSREAFAWLYARRGKTVTISERKVDLKKRYHYGERNVTDWESQGDGEWTSQPWVVELPDDAIRAKENADHVDESQLIVAWSIPKVGRLPYEHARYTVDPKGLTVRFPENITADLNDDDHGEGFASTRVVRIED